MKTSQATQSKLEQYFLLKSSKNEPGIIAQISYIYKSVLVVRGRLNILRDQFHTLPGPNLPPTGKVVPIRIFSNISRSFYGELKIVF